MKVKNILFISPNPHGPGRGRYKPYFPPLALMQLKGLAPPDYKMRILDEAVSVIDYDYYDSDWIPDLVAISVTMTAARPRAIQIAREFRQRGKKIVYGGVDPTFAPRECLEYADYVFRGEAEGGWLDFLRALKKDEAPPIFNAQPHPLLENLAIPFRFDLNPRDYVYFNTIQTARGCPNNCDFCSVWTFSGRKLRFKPVKDTLSEIKGYLPAKRGPVIFVNDNIVADFDYAEELFRGLIPLERTWFGQADMTLLDRPDLVRLASQSGCAVLFIGFESFNPDSLREAGKPINKVEEYREVVRLLHMNGISIIPANIFGFDSDDFPEFERCRRALHRMKADAPQFSCLTPLPGTRLFQRMKNEGRLRDENLAHYDGTHVVYEPRLMSAKDLEQGFHNSYRWYYNLRRMFWRLVSDIWFWRHPLRRLNFFRLTFGPFVPRIWAWVKRSQRPVS